MKKQMNSNEKIYNFLIITLLTISLAYAVDVNSIFQVIRICQYYNINCNLLY